MSRWNHSICDACWPKLCEAGGMPVFDPVRIREAYRKQETCCFCAVTHISGIFVREDPESKTLKCGGVHPGDEE